MSKNERTPTNTKNKQNKEVARLYRAEPDTSNRCRNEGKNPNKNPKLRRAEAAKMRINIKHFDNSFWLVCPKCGKKILEVYKDTTAENLPIWCRNCKSGSTLKRITWEGGRQCADFSEG